MRFSRERGRGRRGWRRRVSGGANEGTRKTRRGGEETDAIGCRVIRHPRQMRRRKVAADTSGDVLVRGRLTRGGGVRGRASGGDESGCARERSRGDVPTGENSPVAAAKTARSISGASSVATGAFLPGVADIRVSGFPRRTEPRVGASDAPVRAARRVLSADRVRAAHPHEHARREHRAGVAGATRAVAVTTLIVSSNQSRASLFARRSASPARSRGGRGVWVSSAERSRAERTRREDRERVEMSDAPLL